MSNEADRAIKGVLDEFGEAWNAGTVWRVQGTAVISHKALERIAARAKIRFDLPTVIRAERDEAVMLVVGYRGEAREWSVGECVIGQNYKVSGKQAAYPWAMSEKRAKDRVILKLLSLHGLAYSEEEADDFKNSPHEPAAAPNDDGQAFDGNPAPDDECAARDEYINACRKQIATATDAQKLRDWWASDDERQARRDFGLSQNEVNDLKARFGDRLSELASNPFDDAPRANGHSRPQQRQREGARAQ